MAQSIQQSPTKNTVIGSFEDTSKMNDIFQIRDGAGAILSGMTSAGIIYNGSLKGNVAISAAPIVSVTILSSAQILALNTMPVIVVPTPGPGLYIAPQSVVAQYNAGGTPYTVTGSDGFLLVGWGGQPSIVDATAVVAIPNTNFLSQVTSQVEVTSSATNSSVPLSQTVNQPLVIKSLDTLTLGNGTLQITISYTITAV
jgi:hypothetical protein